MLGWDDALSLLRSYLLPGGGTKLLHRAPLLLDGVAVTKPSNAGGFLLAAMMSLNPWSNLEPLSILLHRAPLLLDGVAVTRPSNAGWFLLVAMISLNSWSSLEPLGILWLG